MKNNESTSVLNFFKLFLYQTVICSFVDFVHESTCDHILIRVRTVRKFLIRENIFSIGIVLAFWEHNFQV